MYLRMRVMPQGHHDLWCVYRQPRGVAYEPARPHPQDVHIATLTVTDTTQIITYERGVITPTEERCLDMVIESIHDREGWGNNTPEPFIFEVDT